MSQLDRSDLPHTPTMDVFKQEEDRADNLKLGLCIALYAMLALIWMPGIQWGQSIPVVAQEEGQVHSRKVLRRPPEKPLERVKTREKAAKKVPMPDMTPDKPEPEIAVSAPPEPDVVFTDDWEIGIPEDGPPAGEAVATIGTAGLEPPVFTKRVPPRYPQSGLEVKLQGYVLLEAVLRKDGSIDAIKILRGLGKGKFGFEEQAKAALRQWQFLPGRLHGKPTDVRMNLKVDFILY